MTAQPSTPRVHLGIQACQSFAAFHYRGTARYVHDLALQLIRDYPGLIAGLHLDRDQPVPRTLADFCGHGLLREYASGPDELLDYENTPDVYHIMSPFINSVFEAGFLYRILPPAFLRAPTKLVVTLLDLIPLVYEHLYFKNNADRARYLTRLKLIHEADHVLALSECTRNDAVRLLGVDPKRVTVIYGGVDEFFRPADVPPQTVRAQLTRRLPQITEPYILYAGGIEYRKNMEGTLEAYARLSRDVRKSYQMVIGGHMLEPQRLVLVEHARKLGVGERVVFPGFVPDDLLRELYQGCNLFIFPSLYEGLGLPILEAMRCGAPVIASDRSSMKELVEIDRARFNPQDPADVARVMERVLSDEDLRQELIDYGLRRSRQFSWERVAKATVECYRAVAPAEAQGRSRAARHRRLVAFCTPFPPEQSGIADYSKRFLETLAARHPLHVHIVVKGDVRSYAAPGHPAIELVSVGQFRWLADHGHYDRIVYCMGNSSFHDQIYELLKERPGIVWLHDVRLTHFYHWYYSRVGRDVTTLPAELRPWARRYPNYEGDLLVRDNLTQHEQGIYLAGEIASYAQTIVVNSRFSRELMEIESGGSVPVVALPMAAPAVIRGPGAMNWPELASKYGLDETAAPVVSAGIIGGPKCPGAVIDAFAAVASADRNLVLAFVGPCEPEHQCQLERRASQLGIEDRVLFTGYVEEAELDSWLAVARCAIQLRFPTNGESSAAVMRCLAAGVPTIVSDHGPLRELPDDAVVKVPAQVQPADLAQTIRRLLADDEACARLRESAIRHAQEVSFEAVADQFWTEILCAP